jgi:RNA polymerase sigma factor (sigma-70 family)
MTPETEHSLLRQFVDHQSEPAFAALVDRHVNLVYSVALRQTGNPHHAQEITQAVFITLARKAGQLRHEKALSSWLFQTTRLTANNFLRSEFRRHQREQEAYMQSTLNVSTGEVWPRIAPVLDTAVEKLCETDRRAILLRFFEGRNLSEVGTALGISEAAAEKRVSRALEKLRKLFGKRGLTLSAAAIGAAVSANAVQAAPGTLAATVTTAALSGTAATAATLLAATKSLAMTTAQKLAVTAALTATMGAGLYATKQAANARTEAQTARQQQATLTGQIRQLQDNYTSATNRLNSLLAENSLLKSNSDQIELLKLRGEVSVLRTQLADGKNSNPQLEQPPLSTALEYYHRADQHQTNHEYEAALADYTKAIELDPNMADAYMERGDLYTMNLPKELGGEEKAVADFTRCLEIKPNDASARWNRANGYVSLGKFNEAIADWTTYIEGDTDFSLQVEGKTKSLASAYFWRGHTYQNYLHDPTKAIADYTTALQLNPNIEDAHRMRGRCYQSLGNTDQAQQDFAIEPDRN